MINDTTLRNYVDQVFLNYDRDRSGTLDSNELANFFNDVFYKMGNNNRYTNEESMSAMRKIDGNFDGRASKIELYNTLKYLLATSGATSTSYDNYSSSNNYNNYGSGTYNQTSNYSYISTSNQGNNFVREPSTLGVVSSPSTLSNLGYHTSTVIPGYYPTNYNTTIPNNQSNTTTTVYETRYVQPTTTYIPVATTVLPTTTTYTTTSYPATTYANKSYVGSTSGSVLQPTVSYVSPVGTSSVISSSSLGSGSVLESTVQQPGYKKVTTQTGPGGYSKVTTQTYSSQTKYIY